MAILKRYLEAARVPAPVTRRLRVLAFDPSLAMRLETATFNEITVEIPWEELPAGPVGEYVEVVDCDPASGVFYHPVELDNPHLIAQNGLAPSESNPQFHQQMVYAVAMTTIHHFQRALGRVALWADRRIHKRILPGREQGSEQHSRHARLHMPLARHRRSRNDPRAARRRASMTTAIDTPRDLSLHCSSRRPTCGGSETPRARISRFVQSIWKSATTGK